MLRQEIYGQYLEKPILDFLKSSLRLTSDEIRTLLQNYKRICSEVRNSYFWNSKEDVRLNFGRNNEFRGLKIDNEDKLTERIVLSEIIEIIPHCQKWQPGEKQKSLTLIVKDLMLLIISIFFNSGNCV